ncbi:MAG: VWA domain-containing protein [Candidatus Bipolaricaulia bacterium]
MIRRGFLLLLLVLFGAALATLAGAGPRLDGLYRLRFDPRAAEAAAGALQPGEMVTALAPGELVFLAGRGFTPDAVVLFNDLAASPLAPPISNEQRLILIVPQLPPGPVKVMVQTAEGWSNELEVTIQAEVGPAGKESYAAFQAIDRFLFFAGGAVRAMLEELPAPFQSFAMESATLLERERLLALQLSGSLSRLSKDELDLLDSLFVAVGLRPFLGGYRESAMEKAIAGPFLAGLGQALEYKGLALRAIGDFLDQVTVTAWSYSDVTSASVRGISGPFRALGELDEGIGGNLAFLASLLEGQIWEIRWFSLNQTIGALSLQLEALGEKLDGANQSLAAIQERLDQLDLNLGLSLSAINSSMSLLSDGLREITARLDNQVWPGLVGILARLDSPEFGLEEIKAELTALASRVDSAVLSALGAERLLSDESFGLRALAARLDLLEAQLEDPDHGLVEIKAELRGLETKLDRIWRCLQGLTITWEERPAEAERAPLDVILAIDSSGSMKLNDPRGLRIVTAKQFIAQLDPKRDQAGVVSWDNDIDFIQPLTSDLERVTSKIEQVDASGATSLNVGLSAAIDEFIRGRPEAKKVIIFLTDGDGTYTFSGQPGAPASLARQKGIVIYAIGLGSEPVQRKLEDMASATGGRYYLVPTAEDLKQIYDEITAELIVPVERVMKVTCPMD